MEMLTLDGMVHRIEFHPNTGIRDSNGVAGSIQTWDGINETHVVIYDDQVDAMIDWLTRLRSTHRPT